MDGLARYEMGLLRSTSFGRKRVALSNSSMGFTSKRQRLDKDSNFASEKAVFEELPQDILVKILCGVEHDDLKNLFFVSKPIREATLIARQSHFAYNTPRKTVGFRDDYEDIEVPNAPKVSRALRFNLSAKQRKDISVALLDLFTEVESVV